MSKLTRREFVTRAATIAALPLLPTLPELADQPPVSKPEATDAIEALYNATIDAAIALMRLGYKAEQWQAGEIGKTAFLAEIDRAFDSELAWPLKRTYNVDLVDLVSEVRKGGA